MGWGDINRVVDCIAWILVWYGGYMCYCYCYRLLFWCVVLGGVGCLGVGI